MKSSPSPPPAPDPRATASAQTESNLDTAIANARLNRVNQTTPWGSINYTQGAPDANGVPAYSADIQLSPAQQALLEQQQGTQLQRGTIAQNLLNRVDSNLSQPLDLSGLHQVNDRGQMYGGAVNRAPVVDRSTQQQRAPQMPQQNQMPMLQVLQALRSLPPQVLQGLVAAIAQQQTQGAKPAGAPIQAQTMPMAQPADSAGGALPMQPTTQQQTIQQLMRTLNNQ